MCIEAGYKKVLTTICVSKGSSVVLICFLVFISIHLDPCFHNNVRANTLLNLSKRALRDQYILNVLKLYGLLRPYISINTMDLIITLISMCFENTMF